VLLPKEVNVPKKVNAFSLMPQHLVAATKVSLIDINQSKRTPMTMEPVTCSGLRKCRNSKMGHTFLSRYGGIGEIQRTRGHPSVIPKKALPRLLLCCGICAKPLHVTGSIVTGVRLL